MRWPKNIEATGSVPGSQMAILMDTAFACCREWQGLPWDSLTLQCSGQWQLPSLLALPPFHTAWPGGFLDHRPQVPTLEMWSVYPLTSPDQKTDTSFMLSFQPRPASYQKHIHAGSQPVTPKSFMYLP